MPPQLFGFAVAMRFLTTVESASIRGI